MIPQIDFLRYFLSDGVWKVTFFPPKAALCFPNTQVTAFTPFPVA